MNKTILTGLAILTLSTSAALASQHTRHVRAMNANASMGAAPMGAAGPASAKDHDTYMKNLHDSGYDPKGDFNKDGTLRQK
jgi:hypothetical protein